MANATYERLLAKSLSSAEKVERQTLLQFAKELKAKIELLDDNGKRRTIEFSNPTWKKSIYLTCSSNVTAAINEGNLATKDILQYEIGEYNGIDFLMLPAKEEATRGKTEISTAKADLNSIVA